MMKQHNIVDSTIDIQVIVYAKMINLLFVTDEKNGTEINLFPKSYKNCE